MSEQTKVNVQKAGAFEYRIPKEDGMRVEGRIFADDNLIESILKDNAPVQVRNVAYLPGIQTASMAMPDIHWGYGFPIGGVAATATKDGVISPGGVGYDIACGVRLVRTDLTEEQIRPKIEPLIAGLFQNVPCGVGRQGKVPLNRIQMQHVLEQGAVGRFSRAMVLKRISGELKITDVFDLPTRERYPKKPANGERTNWVRLDRAIILWKSRSWMKSTIRRPPGLLALRKALSLL